MRGGSEAVLCSDPEANHQDHALASRLEHEGEEEQIHGPRQILLRADEVVQEHDQAHEYGRGVLRLQDSAHARKASSRSPSWLRPPIRIKFQVGERHTATGVRTRGGAHVQVEATRRAKSLHASTKPLPLN